MMLQNTIEMVHQGGVFRSRRTRDADEDYVVKKPSKRRRRAQQQSDTASDDQQEAMLEAEQEDLEEEGLDEMDWSKSRRVCLSCGAIRT